MLKEAAEIKLAGNLVVLRDKLQPYFAKGRYQDALIELAALREPVDEFFENVMVNAEDKDVRINRLTLLSNCASCSCRLRIFHCCSNYLEKVKSLPSGRLFAYRNGEK